MSRVSFGVFAALTISCGTPQEVIKEQAPPDLTASAAAASASPTPSAKPTASARPASVVRTMFVSEAVADCEGGGGPRKCMRVRESEAADWELFYASIAGFKYEKGHAYELRVEVRKVGEPAADASSLEYELVEVVSKKKVAP